MSVRMFRKSFYILTSIFTRSSLVSASSSLLLQRSIWSYVVSRNYSFLCGLQRVKTTCDQSQAGLISQRSIVHTSVSNASEGVESDSADKDEGNLKKLTLDDVMKQWPDNKPLWLGYRRNHKGQIPPKRTRLRCTTVSKKLLTQNPCPVCRVRVEDNYEIDPKDIVFLSQFISPHTGEILDTKKTGVCRQEQKKLAHAIEKARDQGHLPFTIPGPRDPPRQFKAAGIPAPNIRNKLG